MDPRATEMSMDYLLVLCSCPDQGSAAAITTALLEERVAACVNRIPRVRSAYRWQDQIAKDDEVMLVIKTRTELFPVLEQIVLRLHPYELPEIIGVPIAIGSAAYLDWIGRSTR
jgi:periplasmic divalent cation tolerance protein